MCKTNGFDFGTLSELLSAVEVEGGGVLSEDFGGAEELLSGAFETPEEEADELFTLCGLIELVELDELCELAELNELDELTTLFELSRLAETDEMELSECSSNVGTSRSRNAAAATETAIAKPAAPAAKRGRKAAFLNLAKRIADITCPISR